MTNLRLLKEMVKDGVVTIPGDLKSTLRAKVTEQFGTEPENYGEDEAVEGDGEDK